MMRRPAAVADALLLLLIAFQRIARAGAAEDAPTSSTVVPPSGHGKDALAAEAGLRGGVGDPELVFIGVGAHFELYLLCYTGIGSARIAGHPARAPVAQSWSSQSLESLAQSFGFDEPRSAVLCPLLKVG